MSISPPSSSPNASTSTAGRRMARLMPHFPTRMCSLSPLSRARMRARFVLAKILLRYLADRGLGQFGADLHRADHLVLAKPVLQKRLHVLEREGRRAGLQLDEGLG